jgi:NAD(P)-dependent dehydrogenase (short-subunit alcohol dehydrogenase family)
MQTYDASMSGASAQITLPDAVVLITGGSRGIGAGIARAFLEAGARVVVCGRRTPEPDALPEHEGRRAQFIACDVRKPELVSALFEQVVRDYGRLDVLVNNAGGTPPADFADSSAQLVERIIQLGSVAAVRPAPTTVAYGAAKAGLVNATESLAMEWGPRVRVNAIIAGFVATENADEHYGGPEGVERIGRMFPMGRLAEPADIAHACLYLASPLASYVSGAKLAVHGGGEWPVFLYLAKQSQGSGAP